MQSLYYPEFGELEIRKVDRPTPAKGEVLVRVIACGICGSELETFKHRSPRRSPPLIMGHEFCGIVEMESEEGNWKRGSRVVSHAMTTCGECTSCRRHADHLCIHRKVFGMHRNGAFAEYAAVPESSLFVWPENVEARSACLAEPLANGVHVVNRVRRLVDPERVLIIGAGPIGLMCLLAFRSMTRAHVYVVEPKKARRDAAVRLGADFAIGTERQELDERVYGATAGEGMDVVVDAAGFESTKNLSIEIARPGGVSVWLGLGSDSMDLSSYRVTLPEVTVMGTYSASSRDVQQAIDLMASDLVDLNSWTTSFPLEEGVSAFLRMLQGEGLDIKGILTM